MGALGVTGGDLAAAEDGPAREAVGAVGTE